MGDFSKHFSRSPVLLLVNHAEEETLALENCRIAFGEGADGVFLINHTVSAEALRGIYHIVREKYPDRWIGMNFLGAPKTRLITGLLPETANGLWTDNAGYQAGLDDPLFVPRSMEQIRKKAGRGENVLYFGGVSFKHQHNTGDIDAACKSAVESAPYVDVITTSGSETGTAPDIGKIVSMRRALGDHPLAIASGISPANVQPFIPHVNAILCSTGVSDDFTHFNSAKIRELANLIHFG